MDQTATRWVPPRLTYGITPLKASFTEERKREVAALQCARIQRLPVDALVVYDLQDESARTDLLDSPSRKKLTPFESSPTVLSTTSP